MAEGYAVEPADLQALKAEILGEVLTEADPTIRFTELSRLGVLYDALVSAIADEKARCAAELADGHGLSFTRVANVLLLSKARTQQLVERGRCVDAGA